MIDIAVYDLVKNKVWKSQTFLTGGTFIARSKIAFLRGCGGGAAGQSAGDGQGGGAGAGCNWFPVNLTAGEAVTVTIGAGGTAPNGAGGDTSFGSYLSLPGGSLYTGGAAPSVTLLSDYVNATPVGFIISGAFGGIGVKGARSTFAGGTGGSGYGGGGGGFYGPGGNGVSGSGTGGAAAANSGGGGGASSAGTGGAGGSGQLTVFWLE